MSVTILQGDVRDMLRTLPSESVQCVVTSPPYFNLRDYGVDGQIGLEKTPSEFISALVDVFREVRRVLRPDGVCFVNLGDSYAGSGKGPSGKNGIGDQEQRQGFTGVSAKSTLKGYTAGSQLKNPILGGGVGVAGIPAKNLLLIPQRFAIAMQDAGWIVRSQIVWAKRASMPESVRDRPTSAWEPIWMFTKSARYFWDQEAVRTPVAESTIQRVSQNDGHPVYNGNRQRGYPGAPQTNDITKLDVANGANLRNFWLLGPEPSREEHYAAFPSEIPRRCILAATSEKGQCPACGSPLVRVVERTAMEIKRSTWGEGAGTRIAPSGTMVSPPSSRTTGWQPSCQCDAGDPVPQTVLDPFLGSGTTALVADQLGRNAVGVELNPEYVEISRRRIYSACPMFTDVEVAV